MFLIGALAWTLLFVVNRQGWSNFTPWKVRELRERIIVAKGTGGCISKTISELFSSMHSYVLGMYRDIKVRGEGMIGVIGVSETVVILFFWVLPALIYLAVASETPIAPIKPSPRTFMPLYTHRT